VPIEWPPPICYGEPHLDFGRWAMEFVPEVGVLELARGRACGRDGWVCTTEGELVLDLSWHGERVERIRVSRPLWRRTRLRGVCLSIVSIWSWCNYSHLVLESLGRLKVFLDAGFSLSDVDHVLCPIPCSENARRILDRLGIPESKRVWAERDRMFRADVLLAPSFPGTAQNYPPWLVEFLRDSQGPLPERGDRRLYVDRKGATRDAVNRDALLEIVSDHDFEIYDPGTHDDQPADFASAAIVVGAHGAGLTNLIFCAPGTPVMEIMQSDHVSSYYYTLAVSAGLEYGCFATQSLGEREEGDYGPSENDYRIDEAGFEAALERITNGA